MTAKTKAASFIGIEIQENSADMARRSTEINGLQAKLSFICGDIRDCADALPSAQFDVVTANPPYMNAGGGLTGSKTSKMTARHELCCSFDDVAATAARLLKYAGRFYLVHRPRRLADLFVTLRQRRLEPKTLRLVQPYRESEPNLALIEAVRGARPMLKILPTLIVYDGGGYTPELLEIYFGGGEAGGRKPQGLKTQTSGNFFEKKFPEPFKKL
jgi:tRNA1Val (adenine37-N6)-methyltransferase